ncbi:putative ribonuclease H-like domain-containing protein [Tanacetum coccineum]|uniref:Ribonuclease H-like domain-containing protein n=1 Tax=Tanacetum coccineum TaxID=301880 RepID=A0ABQ5BWJ6_9ASTR
MFCQTLSGAARNWFDDLDPKSVDSFEELSQKFLEEFSQHKRFKAKSSHLKGMPPVLRISAFMHGHGHPELAKKLNDKIPKTVDEMFERVRAFIRGEVAVGSAEVARPKIKDNDSFELKGQFLKELCDNTFSGSDHEDANGHIEKVLEIMGLFHIPNITTDQVMLRAFPMSLTGAASHWLRNKPSGSITTWEDLKTKFLSKYCPPARTAKKMEEINNIQQELDKNLYQAWERFKELLMKCPQYYLTEMQEAVLFYNGLDVPTRQILDSRGAIPSKTAADEKVAIQEMAEYSKKWHNGTSRTRSPHYTKDCPLKEEGKTLEEAYYTQFGLPFQGGGYRATALGFYQRNNVNPSKEEDPESFALPCFINNVCFNNALADLGASVSVMPLLTYLNLGLGELAHTKLTVELADRTVKYPKGIADNMLVGIGKFVFPVDFIILDMPEDVKVPLILERPFLSTAHAKIDVFKRKITLRVGEEKTIF